MYFYFNTDEGTIEIWAKKILIEIAYVYTSCSSNHK